jgi:hypothetical protein
MRQLYSTEQQLPSCDYWFVDVAFDCTTFISKQLLHAVYTQVRYHTTAVLLLLVLPRTTAASSWSMHFVLQHTVSTAAGVASIRGRYILNYLT